MHPRTLPALFLSWVVLVCGGTAVAKQPANSEDQLHYAANPPRPVGQPAPHEQLVEKGLRRGASDVPLSGMSRLSVNRPAVPPPIVEFAAASEKRRAGERAMAAGREEEAVRLFAESLAVLLGVQKSAPDFASEMISQKIREVRGQLEKSLGR